MSSHYLVFYWSALSRSTSVFRFDESHQWPSSFLLARCFFLSLYVTFYIFLSSCVCAAASSFFAWLVSVHGSAPLLHWMLAKHWNWRDFPFVDLAVRTMCEEHGKSYDEHVARFCTKYTRCLQPFTCYNADNFLSWECTMSLNMSQLTNIKIRQS